MQITIATSIKYGNYKQFYSAALQYAALLRKYWMVLKNEFDLREGLEFHIRPIKGNAKGKAFNIKNLIELDPRYINDCWLNTIAHECVHQEQYKQGRLYNKNGMKIWKGVTYHKPVTHKQYLNAPWEVEARERSAEFVRKYKNGTNV
jgi:hypothetical protein